MPSSWHSAECLPNVQLNGKCGLRQAQITLKEVTQEGQIRISSSDYKVSITPSPGCIHYVDLEDKTVVSMLCLIFDPSAGHLGLS